MYNLTIIASNWKYITSYIRSCLGGLIQLHRDYNYRFNAISKALSKTNDFE